MKPQDLFLSLREFLGILVPGVVLLYALQRLNGLGLLVKNEDGGVSALVFAAAAYGVGSLAYAAGSRLDLPYERLEQHFMSARVRNRREKFERYATALKARAVTHVFGDDRDLADQWSNKSFFYDYLRLTCPEGAAQLERLEGTQKLFRTFSIVMLVLALNAALIGMWMIAVGFATTAVVSLAFYSHARGDWNYRLVKWIFLAGVPEDLARRDPPAGAAVNERR